MAKEIERKFLVKQLRILEGIEGQRIIQGYVAKESGAITTRIRIRSDQAFITLKGPSVGLARDEYEYAIPLADAEEILQRYCKGRIVCKTRYLKEFEGMTYEIDVFSGRHSGLVLAEIELEHEDQSIHLPPWLGKEVTGDPLFRNYALATIDATIEARWWLDVPDAHPHSKACCCKLVGQFSCCDYAPS